MKAIIIIISLFAISATCQIAAQIKNTELIEQMVNGTDIVVLLTFLLILLALILLLMVTDTFGSLKRIIVVFAVMQQKDVVFYHQIGFLQLLGLELTQHPLDIL